MADEKEVDTGEVDTGQEDGGDKGDGGKAEGEDLTQIISMEDFPEGDDKADGDGKKEEAKKPDAKKTDAEPAKKQPTETEVLKRERDELVRKNKDLNRALHEAREGKKGKKDDGEADEPLTEAQLLGIMQEYKDDPKTLLNVIKYQAEQAAKKAAGKTVVDADFAKKKKESDEWVHKTYPALLEDGHEFRQAVDKAKDELGIGDHPFGELLGTAVTFLAGAKETIKAAYEEGKKAAMAEVGERKRKETVEGADLTPNGGEKKKSATPTADESDVLSRLGLKSKRQIAIYKKMTGGKSARTVTVEE